MRIKIRSIIPYLWFKFNTKQIILFIICLVIILIDIIININKWQNRFKYSNKNSKLLYLKTNELNFYNDPILSQRQFDIVLSYYSEDIDIVAQYIRYLKNISNIEKLNPRVIVYNKNSNINNQVLKLLLDADIIQLLPNLGREGGTYLYHIINNYHIIANHTLFSQAGVEGITDRGLADWYFDRLEKQFNSSVGYMPLVTNIMISNYDCDSHITGNFPRMSQLWAMLEQSLCPPGGQAVAFRGQFLVSSKRIQNRPLSVYKYIYDLITANSSHWLHRDLRSLIFKSTPDNPIFGHVVERIWTILFKCFKSDLHDRCRRRECACFDES
ncbi:unnamed protein product [Rotaria sordida]|uniref:Uncharacterized protein n=1 Tax=Rotaria sordida TaxID=392033 RepID=A0A819ERL8_9BILA|nr:unnamed protein product [Rotaria sordida]CAF1242554.1 unnamed protein product [Rotaria sordida]CAF1306230.1 unnamed protein product [Rotaria sordida]CAF1323261.1 unnamed protein product [Rotaria sordida]CAF1499854.1 unnamed protein product [Rotaria sordida]